MDYHDCERIASRIVLYEGFLADVHVAKLGILFLFSCRVRCLFWPISPFFALGKIIPDSSFGLFCSELEQQLFYPVVKLWKTLGN